MPEIKVSIIVPVYNAEKYIGQCITSVLNQTLKEIEIIIINDGSVDNSLELIKQAAGQDTRVKIIDQGNMGVSVARNNGIKIARGEFIGFVDADDWVEAWMFEILYTKTKNANADLAICNVNGIDDDKIVNRRLRLIAGIIDLKLNAGREIKNFLKFSYDNANWNKLYNTAIIKKNLILFNEKMSIWEDLLFNLFYIHFISHAIVIDECLYNYRFHSASVMKAGEADIISEFNLLYENFIDFAEKENFQNEKNIFRKEIVANCYSSCISWALNKSKADGNNFIQSVKQFKKEIKRINSSIYTYEKSEAHGIHRIKQNLLYHKRYNLFSFLVILRSYFGKSNNLKIN